MGPNPTRAPSGWECPNCGNFNDPDEDYCDSCGADTDGVAPDISEEEELNED